jgi:hypothetical protein
LDLRLWKSLPLHEKVKQAFFSASPWAVYVGLFGFSILYFLAWLIGPINAWLLARPTLVTSVAFGLGWLAFTTLLSAERNGISVHSRSRAIASSGLGAELEKFAGEQKLELDIFAYSGETLLVPLSDLFDAMMRGGQRPRPFTIRVLLKDWETVSFLPGCADSSETRRYREDTTHSQIRRGKELKKLLDDWSKELKFTFKIKVYFVDPFHKGFLINRQVGFWSLYRIKEILSEYPNVLDYEGKGAQFAEFRHSGTPAETLALHSMIVWFDKVWDSCCSRDFEVPPGMSSPALPIDA